MQKYLGDVKVWSDKTARGRRYSAYLFMRKPRVASVEKALRKAGLPFTSVHYANAMRYVGTPYQGPEEKLVIFVEQSNGL